MESKNKKNDQIRKTIGEDSKQNEKNKQGELESNRKKRTKKKKKNEIEWEKINNER